VNPFDWLRHRFSREQPEQPGQPLYLECWSGPPTSLSDVGRPHMGFGPGRRKNLMGLSKILKERYGFTHFCIVPRPISRYPVPESLWPTGTTPVRPKPQPWSNPMISADQIATFRAKLDTLSNAKTASDTATAASNAADTAAAQATTIATQARADEATADQAVSAALADLVSFADSLTAPAPTPTPTPTPDAPPSS
jgi:hypothetical protein